MKFKIAVFVILFSCNFLIAQTKLGTIDSDYIINKMPERALVLEQAKKYGAKLDSSFAIKVKEYEDKVKAYQEIVKTLSDEDKKTKIQEITSLERDLQQFKQNGNKLMQIKENELMRPLYNKLSGAISEVSKKNGYTQVLTVQGNQFVFIDERFDLTKLVLNKLGIVEETATKN